MLYTIEKWVSILGINLESLIKQNSVSFAKKVIRFHHFFNILLIYVVYLKMNFKTVSTIKNFKH